jgi:heme-degrading monooxygenase HmoA
MPKLSWSAGGSVDDDRTYVALVSRLPLSSYRYLPGFVRDTALVRRQLKRSEGLIEFSLWAEGSLRRFWTLSVWRDRASMTAFVAAEPHRTVMRRASERLGDTAFTEFEICGRDLPAEWAAAVHRIDD